jgi:hypothetical protein
MNTVQITHALEQDPVTSKKFCGVFPSDKLPQTIDRYPCGFVAHNDPSSEPGTHWVAFYFPLEGKGEFFDSYGHAPEYYRKSFGDFLKSFKDLIDNNIIISDYQHKAQVFYDYFVGQTIMPNADTGDIPFFT